MNAASSFRSGGSGDPSFQAVAALIAIRSQGLIPDIQALWKRFDPHFTLDVLSALIKADVQCRFREGERPEINEYLVRFPILKEARERVVSLVYEEYFLRERVGEAPSPDSFCKRYEPWQDSLASQLRYHQVLSQIIGVAPLSTKFPSPGDHFGSFRLRSVLGQGGSARVFLAWDERLGDREVALKVSADHSDEPTIQGRLSHAHIVPVLSVHDDAESGLRGLSMPYKAGLPLDKVIHLIRPGTRPKSASALREAIQPEAGNESEELDETSGWNGFPSTGTYSQGVAWVVSIVSRALAYAHAHKVLHRDVKPANVLLTFRDGPQLLDFNLAHSARSAEQAEEALRGGTLPYMAPEQLEAFRDPELWGTVGEAADIFSVGLLLREMLTGERPEAPRQNEPLTWVIPDLLERREKNMKSVRSLNPDVPHALEAIVNTCLATRPADRFPSASALAEDLRRFLEQRPLLFAKNPSRAERTINWLHRSKTGLTVTAVGAMVAGVVLQLAFFGGVQPKPPGGALAALAPPVKPKPTGTALEHFVGGMELWKEKQPKAAAEEFQTSLEIDRKFFKSNWMMGALEHQAKHLSASVKYFQVAYQNFDREVEPAQRGAFFMAYGLCLKDAGQWAESRKMYKFALDSYNDPSMHFAYNALAGISIRFEDYKQAQIYLEDAIKLAEKLGNNEGILRSDGYRIEHSGVCIKQATKLQNKTTLDANKEAASLLRLAEADLATARRSQAKLDANDQFSIELNLTAILLKLGDIYSFADDYHKSISFYEQARSQVNQAEVRLPGSTKAKDLQGEIAMRVTKEPIAMNAKQTVPYTAE